MKSSRIYGPSAAAMILTEVVNEHPDSEKIGRKVARTISQFNVHAIYLENSCQLEATAVVTQGAKSGLVYEYEDALPHCLYSTIVLYRLLVADYIARCDEIFCNHIDQRVNSFVKNVIIARHKAWLDVHLPLHKQAIK